MSEYMDLPDFATMRRTIKRTHEADLVVGIRCPRSECGGSLRRERGRLVCDGCRRDVRLD